MSGMALNKVVVAAPGMTRLTIQQANELLETELTHQDLAYLYKEANYNFWSSYYDEGDYDRGTEKYAQACAATDAWEKVSVEVSRRIEKIQGEWKRAGDARWFAIKRGEHRLAPFMTACGYRDGAGWWVLEDAS